LGAKLGAAGRQRVIDAFLPDTSLGQWEDLLVQLMSRDV
jgi:hypothetical protein